MPKRQKRKREKRERGKQQKIKKKKRLKSSLFVFKKKYVVVEKELQWKYYLLNKRINHNHRDRELI